MKDVTVIIEDRHDFYGGWHYQLLIDSELVWMDYCSDTLRGILDALGIEYKVIDRRDPIYSG